MTTLETALKYAKHGFSMIPIAPKSKRPILADWTTNCFKDTGNINKWFSGNNNIGIVTGKVSDILVIDIDVKDGVDGRESISDFEVKMGSYLPDTVSSKTQSGGLHLWFKYPKGVNKITGKVGILNNVDIRADGNQVVVYPSVGEKGQYTWVNAPWDINLATLPKAWAQFITGEITNENIGSIVIPKKSFKLPTVIKSGNRHAKLLSYACSLANKNGIDAITLAGSIKEVNRTQCVPPIENEAEVQKIIDWAISRIGNEKINPILDGAPSWVVQTKYGVVVNDAVFCEEFKTEKGLICINNMFYNENGTVDVKFIKAQIQTLVQPFVQSSLANKVNNLLDALRNACYSTSPVLLKDVIHTKTCSLKIDKNEIEEVETGFSLNKLNVKYDANAKCSVWKTFLNGLLTSEDIVTLQEFMGYCLVPTTIAQKAMFIIGRGKEGKSVIGDIMRALFADSMVQGELHNLQENRFMLAQLENKLVFYDDDLQTQALKDTGTFKKIVTISVPIMVERKGEPHYEILPYAKILANGNKPIESCYDHSDGFYRRLILLKCKPIAKDRKTNKMLAVEIIEKELSGILNWAIEGLQRLMRNNWEFDISEATQNNLNDAEEESNNFISFMNDNTRVYFNDEGEVSSSDLYNAYRRWCDDNGSTSLALRTVIGYIKNNTDEWHLEYTNNIHENDKRVRGFKGISLLEGAQSVSIGKFNLTHGKQNA